jgi:hypothetical protein
MQQVVYIQEKVALYREPQSQIMGTLMLVKRQDVLFFSWFPSLQPNVGFKPDGTYEHPPPMVHPPQSPALHGASQFLALHV